ncbi:MAG: hypothetical protein LBU32_24265 [Clostridiales bacterium]|nr:hypothetical protein [Clostridiales bacterium]
MLFERIYREAPFAGLLGVSSNNGLPRINQAARKSDRLNFERRQTAANGLPVTFLYGGSV